MGRFYADLNNIQHDESLKQSSDKLFATLVELHMMSQVDKLSQKQSALFTDRDGDIVMAETPSASSSISPFREKFSFEWFSFDGNKQSSNKAPLFSPVSPGSSASKLSVSTASPSSYFSDVSPTTADPNRPPKIYDLNGRRPRASQLVIPPPPSNPLQWIWQCHKCNSRYPLAVTRRCLIDGHFYCSGSKDEAVHSAKRRKRKTSCTSEFDYVGWKDWGRWSRKSKALKSYAAGHETGPILKNCENCNYPSECRYNKSFNPRERLDFSDYIDDNDLDAMLVDEVEELISPERRAFEEECLTRSRSVVSVSSKAQTVPTSSQDAKNIVSVMKIENTSNTSTTSDKSITPRRARFYSGFTSSISSANSSSARDSSEKGKFDPTLPSVSSSSSLAMQKGLGQKGDIGYINAIEANLRSALPNSPQTSHPPTRRSQSSPQTETISSRVKYRKRLNTKADDPEFMMSMDEAKSKAQLGLSSKATKSTEGLTRTTSEQSFITDLFRQVKEGGVIKTPPPIQKFEQASNEDDILEFLQLKNPRESTARSEATKKITVDPLKTPKPSQHFEDIQLTPKDLGSRSTFAEMLLPTMGTSDDSQTDTDPVKRDSQVSETVPKSISDKGVITGLGGGLFSFGFGRK